MDRKKYTLINLAITLLILTTGFASQYAFAENIDPDNDGSQYAWSENAGWINLEPGGDGGQGVDVSATQLTGYAWGENIGWIKFDPAFGGVVNDGNGNLYGYAWGENVGWINFAPAGGGVTIDSNGVFSGYAWGENIGWINFAPIGGGVKTSWSPPPQDTDGDGIPDGDGSNPCTGGNIIDCDDNCINTPNADQADADSDGVGDACDNCREVENWDQADANSAEDDNTALAGIQHYGDVCDPDFDNSGFVNIIDFNEWRKYSGQSVPPAPESLDISGDRLVWIQDFNIWRQYYGKAPGPGIGD